jgi:hypothetical protein
MNWIACISKSTDTGVEKTYIVEKTIMGVYSKLYKYITTLGLLEIIIYREVKK